MADPTINFNTSLSSTPTAAPVPSALSLSPSLDLIGSVAPTTPAATNSSDDLVDGAVQNLDGTSGMAPYDPGPSAPAVPSLAAASDLPALATPPADPNQVSLLQNPGYVPATPSYAQDTSLTGAALGQGTAGVAVAAPPLSSQEIAVTPYDSKSAAVSLDGSLNPAAGTAKSAPATPPPAPSLTNGGIAILCGRGTTYAVNLSTTASKGYCAIEEWTRYFHQDPFAGYQQSDLTTGATNIAKTKNAAAMVPVLFTGLQISQQDVVGRTLCMDNIKILYSFGRNFGDVAITGEILLGNFDDASKAQTTIKSFSDFFWQYRVSNYLLPVTVSLLKETYLVYLEGLSIGAIDPQTHIMPFMIHGTLLDIARDTATQQINSAGLVLTSTDVTQSSIAKALAKTTGVDTTTLTGVTSFSFAVDGMTAGSKLSAIQAITGTNPITGLPAAPVLPGYMTGNTSDSSFLNTSQYATAPINATDPTSPFALTSVSSNPIAAATSLPGKANPGALGAAYETVTPNSAINAPSSTLPESSAFNFTPVTPSLTNTGLAINPVPGFDPSAVNSAPAVTGVPDTLSAVNPDFETPISAMPISIQNTAPSTSGESLPATIQPSTISNSQASFLLTQGLYSNEAGVYVRAK